MNWISPVFTWRCHILNRKKNNYLSFWGFRLIRNETRPLRTWQSFVFDILHRDYGTIGSVNLYLPGLLQRCEPKKRLLFSETEISWFLIVFTVLFLFFCYKRMIFGQSGFPWKMCSIVVEYAIDKKQYAWYLSNICHMFTSRMNYLCKKKCKSHI